jgi:hypothetical protein
MLEHVRQADEGQRLARDVGGRITAISGSRPTMIVSVWWRAWDQRQLTGLRMTMKLASA